MVEPVVVDAYPVHGSHARRLIAIDMEWSLLDPGEAELIRLLAVEMRAQGRFGAEFHSLLKPEKPLLPAVEEFLGITNVELERAPVFASVARKFLGFIGDATLVCLWADVDRQLLNRHMAAAGQPTLPESRFLNVAELLPEHVRGRGSDAIYEFANVEPTQDANSLESAHDVARVYWAARVYKGGTQP